MFAAVDLLLHAAQAPAVAVAARSAAVLAAEQQFVAGNFCLAHHPKEGLAEHGPGRSLSGAAQVGTDPTFGRAC